MLTKPDIGLLVNIRVFSCKLIVICEFDLSILKFRGCQLSLQMLPKSISETKHWGAWLAFCAERSSNGHKSWRGKKRVIKVSYKGSHIFNREFRTLKGGRNTLNSSP